MTVEPTLEQRRQLWTLDPEIAFLNHGSFGACPASVLDRQDALRRRMEREPVQFFTVGFAEALDASRSALAEFLDVDPAGLVFVPNATTGVSAVLRSLTLSPGDELLVTDHAYGACRNALDFVAGRSGAEVRVAELPFPLENPDEWVERVMDRATPRTRLALIDHVTSPTGVIVPLERLIAGLADRGIDTLVDGAHAPGMLELDVDSFGAAYYTGNCHKWICAPKGTAFLWVREDRRDSVRPVTISHGATADAAERPRLHSEFDWVGTTDYTGWLTLPESIRFMKDLLPGGWAEYRRRNHDLAVEARRIVCDALDIPIPCPDAMIGSLASIPLPDATANQRDDPSAVMPLQRALFDRFHIEIPLISWPGPPRRLIRLSAQLYNSRDQYESLAEALKQLL